MPTTFTPLKSPSSFRKLAAGMWRAPNDPTIYGTMDVEATRLLAFLDEARAAGKKLTVTHVVVRAVALALQKHAELNAKVRFWGKLELRDTVDVFVQVSTEGGRDLSGVRIERADEKSVDAIADEIGKTAKGVREGADRTYEKSRGMLRSMPWWMTRFFVWLSSFLVNELHFHLPKLGMPRDPFGSAMVTNVGMFGIDTAFAPFTPIGRCPILLLVPEVRQRPWVEDGQVVARPILRLCATFDHRIIYGYHAGLLARTVQELLADPEKL